MLRRTPRNKIPEETISKVLILYDGKIPLKTISLKTGVPVGSIRTLIRRLNHPTRTTRKKIDPIAQLRDDQKRRETRFAKAHDRIIRGLQIALTQPGGMDAKTRR